MNYLFTKRCSIVIILMILTNLLVSCTKPKDLEYRGVKNIMVDKVGFAASSLKMDLSYYNPNNFGLNLKRVDLEIWVDNNYLGKTAQDYQIAIPRSEEFLIPIIIELDMKNLLKNSLASFLSNEVLIKVTGSVRVGKLNIYKSFPVNYEGKQRLNLF